MSRKRTSCFAPRLFRSCAESRPEPVPYNIANRKIRQRPHCREPQQEEHCRRPEDDEPALPRTVPPPVLYWTPRTLRASSPDNRPASPSLQRRTAPAKRPPSAYRRDRPPPAGCSPGWLGMASAGRALLRRHGSVSCPDSRQSWLLFLHQRLARCIFRQRRHKRRCICFSFPDRPTSCFFPPAFVVYGRCSVD